MWEGYARFNISKDGDRKYREVYLFLRRKNVGIVLSVQRFSSKSVRWK